MKTLKVYEIGVDNLPKDGSQIVFWNSKVSFGIFQNLQAQEGDVTYIIGENAETLEDALSKGHQIHIDRDIPDTDDDIILLCNNFELKKGTQWMYVHEYYPVVSSVDFPFQTNDYFQLAIQEKWITVRNEESYTFSEEDYSYLIKNSDLNQQSVLDFSYKEIKAIKEKTVYLVVFNNTLFSVTFNSNHIFKEYSKL